MKEKLSALIIKDPWINLILNKKKVWEIRGSNIKKRGKIALIKSGTKEIFGTCNLVNCYGPLTIEEMELNFEKHKMPISEINLNGMPYKNTYAWELNNVQKFVKSIPYNHPKGAIIWVNVEVSNE